MSLLIGTSTGMFRHDGSVEEVLGGTRVNHIVDDGEHIWLADGKGRIHRDGGIAATLPDGAAALCTQPTPSGIFVGSTDARLFALENGSVVEDEFFADAPGRESWYTPWGAPADVRSMSLDLDTALYINVHVGGIIRYDNTGPVATIDIGADVHQVAAHASKKGAVFAACAYGVASAHNGHDFEIRSGGLHASYCRAVAVKGDMLFASASTGPRTNRGRLYRGQLWDGDFEPLTHGLGEWFDDNLNTHCLIVKGDAIYAGLGDTVWVSEDDGDSFEIVASGLPKITCLA